MYNIHFLWKENNLLSTKINFRKEITTQDLFKFFLDSVLKNFCCHECINEYKIKYCSQELNYTFSSLLTPFSCLETKHDILKNNFLNPYNLM
jgi:hypothetical protein